VAYVSERLALTVEQAAEELQVSAETVRRMLARGELVGRRIGNRWRLPARELEEWQSRGERPPAAVVQMEGRRT
jgi:excisionase family DNA binding protein